MSIVTFLQQVVTTESGYFCLAIRNGNWQEHFYRYPDDIELIAHTAEQQAPQGDVYFSTYLFNEKSSIKNNVLPSRTIQQDLDFADITQLPLSPSQLVRTSPGRHQGYWLLSKQLPMDQHEQISKRLAYAIDDCDLSGWPLGRKVRLPHTLNHKYDALPPVDWLEQQVVRTIAPEDIELLPDIGLEDKQGKFQHDEQFINYPPPTFECGPQELLDRIKDLIPSKVYSEYDLSMPDRSRALWGLMLAGFRAGLTRESVYWLARGSANNKWFDLKRGGERELAKDVERAERYLASGKVDTKAIINELRRSKARAFERNQAMYDIVVASMKTDGQFLHTQSERKLFVPHDTGRPISIGPMSPRLTAYIDLNFGLNRSEPEHRFVHSALESFSTTVPPTTKHGALSRYLPEQQLLVVHNNRQTVHAIDPKSMVRAVNGSHNVVFDWNNSAEPFNAAAEPYVGSWSEAIFGSLQNVVSLTPAEAHAVLKCWLMFLLFRTGFSTRPILALLGQPGSSKTTTATRVLTFLYGRNISVSGVTKPEAFDYSMATLPLFVLDNADTYERWLLDKIAQAAKDTDFGVRQHYSNTDMVWLKKQALLLITAHNPSWIRPDIVDRLLLLTFQRVDLTPGMEWKDETTICNTILENRNALWASILQDCQLILQTPKPQTTTVHIRIEDFAKFGEWCSLALGCLDDFRTGVQKVVVGQKELNVETDQILFTYIDDWLERTGGTDGISPTELWQQLSALPSIESAAFMKRYPNPIVLGKKLWNLQATMQDKYKVDWEPVSGGGRLWTLRPRTIGE